jgi:Rrf2 family transcriptional regulator, nitric oxide-sensitive transcriptional repressor
MQLTKHTDYALRVLIYLAHRSGELSTIKEIADMYGISENHVMKIVNRLARLGYVDTLRGKGGGLRLARPAERINVGEVVRNTEETLYVVECLADDYPGDCRLTPTCRLKSVLQHAQAAFFEHLDRFTLKDLAPRRTESAPVRLFKQRNAVA